MREIEKEKEKDRERLIGVKRERMLTEWEGDVAEGETVERERVITIIFSFFKWLWIL